MSTYEYKPGSLVYDSYNKEFATIVGVYENDPDMYRIKYVSDGSIWYILSKYLHSRPGDPMAIKPGDRVFVLQYKDGSSKRRAIVFDILTEKCLLVEYIDEPGVHVVDNSMVMLAHKDGTLFVDMQECL